ncbi:phosphoadenosine phosphosulfate reductase [Actibacterium sp. 188UL27-1]|uniref:phosphoadenosine phosphosulfate reductase n=1 Tax=Actibacterium sp. 188UL27-1 TaxID=2786961 RepID=UPI00195B8A7A|nr:phosphoadenosine phosphosulfate reductase [Actibacterium sp. 188UL27-1]MBM7069594.1 phosphoadenosine phosphosulfate reductase [Actibacterium sp. 188UL27-1]
MHTINSWHDMLTKHGDEFGFHQILGRNHGALFTSDDETLLVTFENAQDLRANEENSHPMGLSVAGKQGWSHLCIYSEGDTWFRDEHVFNFFDTLVDEGFFDDFERILFFGAGSCGYAAAAFSVAAPGAQVLLIHPQATLDPRVTEWDQRFPTMRRVSFTDRYGYAPAMLDAAAGGAVVYDPYETEDAMHAALFTRDGITKLRCPLMGRDLVPDFENMGIMTTIMNAAVRNKLTPALFARHYRIRRRYPVYLKRVLVYLERQDRPFLTALYTREVLRRLQGPRFKRAQTMALRTLQARGQRLPPSLSQRNQH